MNDNPPANRPEAAFAVCRRSEHGNTFFVTTAPVPLKWAVAESLQRQHPGSVIMPWTDYLLKNGIKPVSMRGRTGGAPE